MGDWSDFYANPLTIAEETWNLYTHAEFLTAVDSHSGSLLEVGVGSGSMSRYLAQRGHDVVGVDTERSIVDAAEQAAGRIRRIEYRVVDARYLSSVFAPHSFAVAFSQGFFEHFADDEVRELVGQQLTVADAIVFSVPSDRYPALDFGNERRLKPEAWKEILAPVGSVDTRYYGVNFLPLREAAKAKFAGTLRQDRLHVLVTVTATLSAD